MWSSRSRASERRGLTLAGQFLLLQCLVLLLVVVVVSIVSLRQSDADFRDDRESRLRAAAESLAGIAAVRDGLAAGPGRASSSGLSFYLQTRADNAGASAAYLVDRGGLVLAATDPTRRGERIELAGDVDRTWTGDIEDVTGTAIAARVPVYAGGTTGPQAQPPEVVGAVVVTQTYPPVTERLAHTSSDVLVVLGSGLTLGLLGSWALARLIKRRTRGLEPDEIAALADHREGLLRSIREGVVAVGEDGRISLMSDSARELLGLRDTPEVLTGRHLDDLRLDPRLRELLAGEDEVRDAVLIAGDRVLVLNRNRVRHAGRPAGTVTTLRDRTELLTLQSELNARESVTETLRAQTHEFSNQLHTISGLLQLEEYAEVNRFVERLTALRAELSDFVTARVEDPAVAALLIAKSSLAAERRVSLELDPDSALPRLDPEVSADVATVLGNLVDNGVDAAAGGAGPDGAPPGPVPAPGALGRVQVRLGLVGDEVEVRVSDTGPGVPPERVDDIFRRGYSTKPGGTGGRGVGLALVQVVCERRGGSVAVEDPGAGDGSAPGAGPRDGHGAVFTARLPLGGGTAVPSLGAATGPAARGGER